MFNVAEVQLIYRSKVPASQRRSIKCSRDAYDLFLQSRNPDTIEHSEEFKLLLINRSNAVLGLLALSKGGLSGTVTDVRLIFQAAIKAEYSTHMSFLTESKPVVEAIKEEAATLSDVIRNLQEKVNPEGLKLEIVGKWLWLSGATFAVKEALKELGFRYSPGKKS